MELLSRSTKGARYGRDNPKKEDARRSSGGESRSPHTSEQPTPRSAENILGVSLNASKDKIIAAYRKMAQMYHPDKVSGLGPEFKEVAELRMKEINAAYAELSHGPNG